MAETPNTPNTPDVPDTQTLADTQLNHIAPAPPTATTSLVEQRLTGDGARWARSLPAADALTAWANALPEPSANALPTPTRAIRSTRGAPIAAMPVANLAPTPSLAAGASPSKGRHPVLISRIGVARTLATVAAVLVVALMATIFVALAGGGHGVGRVGRPAATAVRRTPTVASAANVTPGVFPGPLSQQVSVLVSSTSDVLLHPADATTHFQVGAHVYIAVTLEHASGSTSYPVTVVWYLNGRRLGVSNVTWSPPYTDRYKPAFAVNQVYDAPGEGMAKVYLNALNPGSPTDDNSLAQTAIFIVQ